MVPAFAALWFTTIWYVYMFSLPFSNGENFQFNLNPNLSVLIAIVALPLLSSVIFVTASKVIEIFGAASAVAVLVICINVFANVIPTDGVISLLLFYLVMTIVLTITADIVLNNATIRSRIGVRQSELIAGALVGSIFYIFGYPMLTWAFAIPLNMQFVNLQGIEAISNLTFNFLSTLSTILAITLVPGTLMGIAGAFLSSKKLTLLASSHLGLQIFRKQDRKISQ
jgi:hypothetical protein